MTHADDREDSFADPQREQRPSAAEQGFEIGSDGISAVVVGFDGTDPSRDALAFASGIVRRGSGRLIVVYVIQSTALMGISAAAVVAVRESAIEEARGLGREVKEGESALGVNAVFVVREGDAAREIESVANDEHADLIVVGRSHSRTHAVMGSVAVALVRHAQRPVSVVP